MKTIRTPSVYNPHELLKCSDIRLKKRAVAQRWIKTTVMVGCRASCSFATEDWQGFCQDIELPTEVVALHITANKPLTFTSHNRTITLHPPKVVFP